MAEAAGATAVVRRRGAAARPRHEASAAGRHVRPPSGRSGGSVDEPRPAAAPGRGAADRRRPRQPGEGGGGRRRRGGLRQRRGRVHRPSAPDLVVIGSVRPPLTGESGWTLLVSHPAACHGAAGSDVDGGSCRVSRCHLHVHHAALSDRSGRTSGPGLQSAAPDRLPPSAVVGSQSGTGSRHLPRGAVAEGDVHHWRGHQRALFEAGRALERSCSPQVSPGPGLAPVSSRSPGLRGASPSRSPAPSSSGIPRGRAAGADAGRSLPRLLCVAGWSDRLRRLPQGMAPS